MSAAENLLHLEVLHKTAERDYERTKGDAAAAIRVVTEARERQAEAEARVEEAYQVLTAATRDLTAALRAKVREVGS